MSAIVVKQERSELAALDQAALLHILQKAYQTGELADVDSQGLIESIKKMLVESCDTMSRK